jgi:hypothetical protein
MKANKKADDLIFWARQFAYDGKDSFSQEKKLEHSIFYAKQIAICAVDEVEKALKSSYKLNGHTYAGSKESLFWKEVLKEVKNWEFVGWSN